MLKISQIAITLLAAATLVACGGGSSGTGSTSTPTPPLATAKYLGTWNSVCDTDDIQANGAAGSYVITSLELTTNTATAVSGTLKSKVYGYTDSTCSTLLSTLSQGLSFTIDSVGTGAGGSDKITGTVQNAAISGVTVTITSGSNSITYPNSRTIGSTEKDLVLASTTALKFGNDTVLDASGYPTALDNSIYGTFTKQ